MKQSMQERPGAWSCLLPAPHLPGWVAPPTPQRLASLSSLCPASHQDGLEGEERPQSAADLCCRECRARACTQERLHCGLAGGPPVSVKANLLPISDPEMQCTQAWRFQGFRAFGGCCKHSQGLRRLSHEERRWL